LGKIQGCFMTKTHLRQAATTLAIAGIGLAMSAPFMLGAHAVLAGLRSIRWDVFLILAASAAVSAAAKAGKLQLMQEALGLRLRFARTFAITVVTDSAFLISPLGAAGYGVNMGLLQRAGAPWATATTVVAADQALDLTFFALAVPVALLLALGPLAQITPKLNLAVVAASLLGVVLLAGIAWACRRRVGAMLDRAGQRIAWLRSRRVRLQGFVQNVRRQFAMLITGPLWRFIALLVLTTLQWMLRYSALWFILLRLGYRLPLGFVLAVQAVVLHAALWTGVPAGGGGGDLGLAAAFAPWVPWTGMATALVLWRFATLYCPLLLGAMGVAALAWRRHAKTAVLE
jgi:glycosyltransferase 2 family protein